MIPIGCFLTSKLELLIIAPFIEFNIFISMKKKILIIEDSETLGKNYKDILTHAGYLTKWMPVIQKAENIANKFPADLLLLDQNFHGHGKDGVEKLDELKKRFPKSIIIILSGYSKMDIRAMAVGGEYEKNLVLANGFWEKIDVANEKDLIERVNKLFENKS
jgi:CheY-like chemotaxis protein